MYLLSRYYLYGIGEINSPVHQILLSMSCLSVLEVYLGIPKAPFTFIHP